MYTLYIDTHSDKIVIILYKEKKLYIKKELESNFNHSVTMMNTLIEVLEEAKIDIEEINEILVVNGPGSFTGVRIGVTIAKTLAYTLQIPIKAMSSLLIKAVSFTHQNVNIIEREKNGVFLAKYDSDNKQISAYEYLKNSEYEERKLEIQGIEEIKLDYEKIIDFSKNIKEIHPHAVNPLYVKKIEVQK